MAETLPQFILARVAQGLGGAMIFPVGRAIVLRAAHASQLMQATAVLTWPALFAPVIGPVIGGGITSFVGWRWNFLLNVPLGLIGIVLAVAILPAGGRAPRRPLDWVGALLTAAALFLLIYGLGALGDRHSLARPIVLLIVGGAIGAADLLWLARARHPLLDLGSLKVPTFALSTVTAGNFCLIAVSAAPFLIPLMMQEAWGLSPLQAGGWVLFYFLGNLLAKTRTTATLRRFGFRPVMVVAGLGIGVTVCACGLLAPVSPTIVIVALLFAAGATRSMQLTAINTLAFSDVPQDRRAASSTLSAMIQQVSMALGVAIAAVAINLARGVHGAAQPGQGDFRIAFLVCGMIGAAGGLICLRLPRDAGAEVSGYVPRNARRNEVTI